MKYKQCLLKSDKSIMTVWLDADKVKLGIKVTLKTSEDPSKWWKIIAVYSGEFEQADVKKYHNPKALFGSIN